MDNTSALYPSSLGQHNCSDDYSFGPRAVHCREGLDLTLLFEESFLTILPAALILLIAPWRVYQLSKRKTRVFDKSFQATKQVYLPSYIIPTMYRVANIW